MISGRAGAERTRRSSRRGGRRLVGSGAVGIATARNLATQRVAGQNLARRSRLSCAPRTIRLGAQARTQISQVAQNQMAAEKSTERICFCGTLTREATKDLA